MDAKLYNIQGKEAGKVTIPESIFGLPWNADLVHQVVVAMQGNARPNVAHTKDRGEVRGGGKKPWQQKGTGRARHGSSRSPIWKGGGVTHGPRNEKDYSRKINRAARQKALLVVLSRKYRDGELTFVDSLASFTAPKASMAKEFLSAMKINKKRNAALIAIPGKHQATMKSFGNFGNIEVEEVRNLNPVQVLGKKRLFIVDPKVAIETLEKKV